MTVATQPPAGSPGAPSPAGPGAPPEPAGLSGPPGPPPAIFPNRRRLDNRFPVLGFSIRTFGLPWFEVLLTTDRSQFDPANAARRTAATFYAGRQDGGLARSSGEETAYIVPASVLRRFADARPRPTEIFYTVAAYRTPDGPPVLALPPAVLTASAPSILLSGDFHAQTLAAVLAIPAEKLAPVAPEPEPEPALSLADPDEDPEPTSWSSEEAEDEETARAASAWMGDPAALALDAGGSLSSAQAAWTTGRQGGEDPAHSIYGGILEAGTTIAEPYSTESLAVVDQGNGTIGADDYAGEAMAAEDDFYAGEASAAEDPYPEGSFAAEDPWGDEGMSADDVYDENLSADDVYDEGMAADQPYTDASLADPDLPAEDLADDEYEDGASAAGFVYDDGYDDQAPAAQSGWHESLESTFPDGTEEPATLEDYDDERLHGQAAGADPDGPYEEGRGVYQSLDTGPIAPTPTAPNGHRDLDIPTKIGIVSKIGRLFETSEGYRGIAADPEFSHPRLPQYQRWHVGLTYGFIGFTQDSGLLGRLLVMMRDRDPDRFRQIFGEHSEELVRVTNLRGPSSRQVPQGRSVRVQPVGGADLWTEPWLSRFRAAGDHPPFQAAQNELAVRAFLDPMLPFAAGFGMDTERALAMLVDRAIQMGVGGANRWLIGAMGPIRTDALRQQCLAALGAAGIRQFQEANGLRIDGDFGPVTHATMVAALRRLGAASPVPIPTREQLMDAIVARATGSGVFWARRPQTIRTSRELADVPLTWTGRVPVGAR